jgi:hypothetical protein
LSFFIKMQGAVVLTAKGEISVAESDPDAVVQLVNSTLGKRGAGVRVALTDDNRGYGLFSTRSFNPGETVAVYGSIANSKRWDELDASFEHVAPNSPLRGYVVTVNKDKGLDAGLFFSPQHAGRYVNESALGQNWMANVSEKNEGAEFVFKAKKHIFPGDEIITHYGEQYIAPWRWNRREATPELVEEMEKVVAKMEQRLARFKGARAPQVVIEEVRRDLEAARNQRDTVSRMVVMAAPKKRAKNVECRLCGSLAQHQEAYGNKWFFCNQECQKEYYQRGKK